MRSLRSPAVLFPLAIVPLLSGCASPGPVMMADQPPGHWHFAGFAYEPPRGPGWQTSRQVIDEEFPPMFVREAPPTRSMVVVFPFRIGDVRTADALLKERQHFYRNIPKIVSRLDPGHGAECVRTDGADVASWIHDLECVAPGGKPGVVISFGMEARPVGDVDPVAAEAEAFLASVRYDPSNVRTTP